MIPELLKELAVEIQKMVDDAVAVRTAALEQRIAALEKSRPVVKVDVAAPIVNVEPKLQLPARPPTPERKVYFTHDKKTGDMVAATIVEK